MRKEQQLEPRSSTDKSRATGMPPTEVATGEIAALRSGLDKLKQQETVFNAAMASLANNPAFRSDEKAARVFVDSIRQESGQ